MRTHLALRLLVSSLAATALFSAIPVAQSERVFVEQRDGPLPRWREGGSPADDRARPMVPFAVSGHEVASRMPPTSGVIQSPPEYSPCDGVLFRYNTSTWPQVVVDCVCRAHG
jgi:hypothetical protein